MRKPGRAACLGPVRPIATVWSAILAGLSLASTSPASAGSVFGTEVVGRYLDFECRPVANRKVVVIEEQQNRFLAAGYIKVHETTSSADGYFRVPIAPLDRVYIYDGMPRLESNRMALPRDGLLREIGDYADVAQLGLSSTARPLVVYPHPTFPKGVTRSFIRTFWRTLGSATERSTFVGSRGVEYGGVDKLAQLSWRIAANTLLLRVTAIRGGGIATAGLDPGEKVDNGFTKEVVEEIPLTLLENAPVTRAFRVRGDGKRQFANMVLTLSPDRKSPGGGEGDATPLRANLIIDAVRTEAAAGFEQEPMLPEESCGGILARHHTGAYGEFPDASNEAVLFVGPDETAPDIARATDARTPDSWFEGKLHDPAVAMAALNNHAPIASRIEKVYQYTLKSLEDGSSKSRGRSWDILGAIAADERTPERLLQDLANRYGTNHAVAVGLASNPRVPGTILDRLIANAERGSNPFPSSSILWRLSESENLSAQQIDRLSVMTNEAPALAMLLRHPNTGGTTFRRFLLDNVKERFSGGMWLIHHANLPADVLLHLERLSGQSSSVDESAYYRYVVSHPNFPEWRVKQLAASSELRELAAAMASPHAPAERMNAVLSLHKDIAEAIARNRSAPPGILVKAYRTWMKKRNSGNIGVARNPSTPTALLREIVFDSDRRGVRAMEVAANPNVTEDLLKEIGLYGDEPAVFGVASNPRAPSAVLQDIFTRHKSRRVSIALAGNPHTPRNTLEQLAASEASAILLAIAMNPGTPQDLLKRIHERQFMASDEPAEYMMKKMGGGLLCNPSTPDAIRERLPRNLPGCQTLVTMLR